MASVGGVAPMYIAFLTSIVGTPTPFFQLLSSTLSLPLQHIIRFTICVCASQVDVEDYDGMVIHGLRRVIEVCCKENNDLCQRV